MPQFAAIVPAAGTSTRYGRNKLLETLEAVSVLRRSLLALLNHPSCDAIYLATNDDAVAAHVRELTSSKPIHVCRGGETRAHSVLSALQQVPASDEWIAVHDAARPLVSRELIDRTFTAALQHGAAVAPALPVHLTIKQAAGPLPAKVQRTVPRSSLWSMQTPQFARREDLLAAFQRCPIPLDQVTDDVQLLELIGKDVWLVPGEESNLKITTPIDLAFAEMLQTRKR
jgi:2-C-methyl-D-erythritol 4-phosphate cytidylyltransferase